MTRTRFRWMLVMWVVTSVWWWSMPDGIYKQPAHVRAAMEHLGKGALIPPSDAVSYAFLFATLASAIGLFFERARGWWLLAIMTAASIIVAPLTGVGVSPPIEGTIGFVSALLNGALLVAALRERPAVDHAETVSVFETTRVEDAAAAQSRLDEAGLKSTTHIVVRQSDAVVAKDVLELGN